MKYFAVLLIGFSVHVNCVAVWGRLDSMTGIEMFLVAIV